MPVMRDWKCDDCDYEFESMEDKPLCPRMMSGQFQGDSFSCDGLTHALPVGTKSYKIKGDNSSSITPKKHAGKP
jgi:hypothetical protein